jgi:SNF2 family DNA or RNA helicase
MLDLLEPCLRKAGIHFRRLDGTMSLTARERALVEFETKPDVTVILMSLKAAGLGVNLTCANHVILSDVWWNPTAEEQAIDRAHRIGQTKEVKVVRFTVRDTVEDRILALQDRKRAMVAAAFGDEAEDQSGSSRRAQLTTEDLVFLFGSEKDAIKK